ncbi:Lactoylglutathione lyase [Vibrio vulnificus]|uniref:Lactoylglutathione lyase n=1 Tax=Vibrio vulnificus (strain CMCP6) TaxID=216895 RepID=A0A3Q0KYF0_VIBVU|nr:VOC family protein [Vibrio vulnificus]AAO07551.1 Lactoylglutathione lyase [Vibrio vulnificus CMCP6]ADV89088.1 lactoylglutathione lyase [Vibrio vulnificus MO6-24/O]EGR0040099.1 VOC family protein [Vibrio vulnificus]EGR0093177.1 VOC family protein [Vibrio vulnificus]EGR0097016.1 VOC family protein [Vibrio vulnificus]
MEKARPIQLQAIDHIVLRVVDLPKMLAFYCDILGCVVEREVAEFGLTQLRAGSALIDLVTVDSKLGQQGGRAPEQEGRNLDHFCLQITPKDEQEILDFLIQNGVKVEDFADRYGAQGFGRSIYLSDPEGNTVELKPQNS